MAQITAMTPVARAAGSHRIVPGRGIVTPLGDVELTRQEERQLRRGLVRQALDALTAEVGPGH